MAEAGAESEEVSASAAPDRDPAGETGATGNPEEEAREKERATEESGEEPPG